MARDRQRARAPRLPLRSDHPSATLRSAIHTGRQCGGIWALAAPTPRGDLCSAVLAADGGIDAGAMTAAPADRSIGNDKGHCQGEIDLAHAAVVAAGVDGWFWQGSGVGAARFPPPRIWAAREHDPGAAGLSCDFGEAPTR